MTQHQRRTTRPSLVVVNGTAQVSGAERVLLRTITAALDNGWDVACLCPEGPLTEHVSKTGARHVAIPELSLGAGFKPFAAISMILRWLTATRALRAASRSGDVIVANTLLSLPAIRLTQLLGRRRSATPAIWLAHDVVVAPGRLRLYRWCRKALTRVVGVSAAVTARLPVSHGSGPRIEIVHNGVAFPVEGCTEWEHGTTDVSVENPAVIGLNGLLTSWKGQDVLLDATTLLSVPVRVEILGGFLPKDAEYAAGLERQVEALGLGDRVSILGHDADPLARMRTWTVAVSASTDPEACPLAVLEAMSLGLPVVATDHGGSPEVLDDSGLLVPPRDASALAEAITRMVQDAPLREKCAARGRERIALAHRLDAQTARLLDVLADTAHEGTAS